MPKTSTTNAIQVQTNRADFLAAHPDIAKVQKAYWRRVNTKYETLEEVLKAVAKGEIAAINVARDIGCELNAAQQELCFPGNQITLDFHRQIHGDGPDQLHVPFEAMKRCQFIARSLDKDIKTVAEAQRFKQFFLAFWKVETGHGQQNRLPDPDPLESVVTWFEESDRQLNVMASLAGNEKYCPGGKLRDDLVAMYAQPWRERYDAMGKMLRSLGVL
jgi:hypothetical protein